MTNRKAKMRALVARFILFALVVVIACGTIEARANNYPMGWTSVRALGMGNAYTAHVSDADALFYNPAGLGKNTSFSWTVFDLHGGINGLENVQAAQELAGGIDDIAETINGLYGKRVWMNGGAKTAVIAPNFGIAGFANTEAGFSAHSPPNPNMDLNYYFDYGISIGGALNLIPNIWSVGLVARRVNRTGTTLPVGPSTLATMDPEVLEAELKRRGTGYGFDFGTTITVPGPVSPSLSFVYRNMGGLTFTHEEGAGAPPMIAPEMVIGGALEVKLPLISVTSALDYRYANDPKIQLGNKVNFGVEVGLPLIDIRAGLHQGYLTAGVGVDMAILRADIATYGVELGAYPGQHEDRRYMAQLTFDIGFDPGSFGIGGFGGSGKPGERRRLKQRR